ncbi:MAG: PLP-dependent aminotransferase family protein [Anaerolineae bacterium]|nr:PLP-dependent aminotransferase family protein [Anaerolineae bacterium]
MRIPLDSSDPLPLYRQVVNHLRTAILSGSLPEGTQLPSTRQLAGELNLSRITIKNAYDVLSGEGLISGREGSGTYVSRYTTANARRQVDEKQPWPLWQQELALNEAPAPDRFLPARAKVSEELISFSGVGSPTYYPVQDVYKALQTVIRRERAGAFEYGDLRQGYLPLRQTISHVLGSQCISAGPEEILITSGSQQALALVCQALLKAGDTILVESPTYNLALELFEALHLKIISLPVDANGMQVEALEEMLQKHHPRLIYTIPNFQNPSGMSLSEPRRRQMISLAERYNVPILEDDFAGDLRYEGRVLPALKTLDPCGLVIYIGTFSKMLMPGLRLGFLIAGGPVLPLLIQYKRVNDLTTSPLIQRAVCEYVTVGSYQVHLRRSCRLYLKQRNTLLQALDQELGERVDFNIPQGGLFLWLKLAGNISSTSLREQAIREGVDFTPGQHFFIQAQDGNAYLRLNFASLSPPAILAGIQRLAKSLDRFK